MATDRAALGSGTVRFRDTGLGQDDSPPLQPSQPGSPGGGGFGDEIPKQTWQARVCDGAVPEGHDDARGPRLVRDGGTTQSDGFGKFNLPWEPFILCPARQ